MDDWLEIARREAGITSGSRQHASVLVCTSYNPEKHCIKGILQPHGVETGWIPVGIIGAGPNFGIAIGPKAGDPQKLDGDQFEISFENGDPNTPIARHRLSSDQDKPPKVETGEIAIVSQFNHNILLKKDGSASIVTNDKDVAGQNKNSNPVISHSATSIQNGKTINHQVVLDPVKQTQTHVSTDGTNTHSTVYDLIKNTLTHSSVTGATPGTPATPVAPDPLKGLPNLPGIPGLSGGTLNFQSIFDLIGGKLTHKAIKGSLTHSTIFDMVAKTLTHQVTEGSNSHSTVIDSANGITHTSSVKVNINAPSTNIVAKNVSIQGFVNVLANQDGTGGVLNAARGLGAPITNAIQGIVPTS
jgi:hypothetical protein